MDTVLSTLEAAIEGQPESFASGSQAIQAAALSATKFVFDLSLQSEQTSIPHISALIASLNPSTAPETRSQARANAQRKQSPPPPPVDLFKATPLTFLFVDGMDEEQIWAQLELRATTVCNLLDYTLESEQMVDETDEDEARLAGALKELENGEDLDEEDSDDDSEEDDSEDGADSDSENEADLGEDIAQLRDPSDDELDPEALEPATLRSALLKKPSRKGKRHSELDDGFFDLASFNAEIEQAEARSVSKGGLGEDSDDDEDVVDFFAPVDPVVNFDEEDLEDNTEAYYKDFFEPPVRTKPVSAKPKQTNSPKRTDKRSVKFHEEVRVKKIKPHGKNMPLSAPDSDSDEEEDDMMFGEGFGELDDMDVDEDSDMASDQNDFEGPQTGREAIERLKEDLFDEGDSEAEEADMTAHEKRMAVLKEQISSLEAENVGKKDWVLMGEAGSRTRPQNSLLEEDLEFERVMKAVPVVTEESVLVLEERIKARILEGRFDDVVRLKPMDDKPFLPSRFFELKDTKSTASLAQIYENEYTTGTENPGEDRDGKLSKEHDEIEHLWENISSKLDALCNAHFMPKQPKATISTIANVSTASLESALPTSKSATDMLAPEEIFAPSPGELRARSELTPMEKRSLRTKDRKAKKRMRDVLDKSVDKYAKKMRGIGGVKKQKQAALESVVKTGKGVTIIGKGLDAKKRTHARPQKSM